MERWEYLTTFVEADLPAVRDQLLHLEVQDEPKFSPLALMPALNDIGRKGWELVHMQPVFVGKNHDVLLHDSAGYTRWSNTYFCVFKRPA